jgi:urease accessory protein
VNTTFSGHLFLRAERRDSGETALTSQSFRAPFHISKPYWDGTTLSVFVVNPTAGILSGDELRSEINVRPGAVLAVNTPSATRVFQMHRGGALSQQTLTVDDGGWLEFVPEPLVPHRGSVYSQHTQIDIAETGELLFGDLLMPGRLARGEAWAWEALTLDLTVKRGGRLLLRERFQQTGQALKDLAAMAGMQDGACFAQLVLISPRLVASGEWRERIGALHTPETWVGLSALRETGAWSLKLIAKDSIGLRAALRSTRQILASILPPLASEARKL